MRNSKTHLLFGKKWPPNCCQFVRVVGNFFRLPSHLASTDFIFWPTFFEHTVFQRQVDPDSNSCEANNPVQSCNSRELKHWNSPNWNWLCCTSSWVKLWLTLFASFGFGGFQHPVHYPCGWGGRFAFPLHRLVAHGLNWKRVPHVEL